MNNFKNKIYNIIRDDDENDLASNIFDGVIITLIIINVVLVIADTFEMPDNLKRISSTIETISVILFTIEYIIRLITADLLHPELPRHKAIIKYVFSFMALIDLFAILPFYLPMFIKVDLRILRTLRMIRLLRLFKVSRYTDALTTIGDIFKKKAAQLLSSMIVVFLLMIISSVLVYNFEHDAQPQEFQNAFSGLWWAIATLTTVGYGDIYPVTVAGKIFSAIIALLGIGIVAVPTGIISAGFIEHLNESKEAEKKSSSEMTLSENDIEMLLYFNKLPENEQIKEVGRIQQRLIDIQEVIK